MKEIVTIKSFSNGILLNLSPDASFEDILQETASKFASGKAFFGRASVALSIVGREIDETEEIQILDAVRKNSNLNVICLVGHDETADKNFIKALQQVDKHLTGEREGQLYKGSLSNGESIETENSLVLLGDVAKGCKIISSKNIIVLGGLYGEAYAGEKGQNAYIAALEMAPERLKIGDFKYRQEKKKSRWGVHPKVQPKIAYVKNEGIVFDALTKETLDLF